MSSLSSRPTPPAVIALEAVARARSSQNVPIVPIIASATVSPDPRVEVVASPNGTVRIVGKTLAGEWVAEHCCKASRFAERHIRAMIREVEDEEAKMGIAIAPARVLPFPKHG